MKITQVRSVKLDGELDRNEPIWEERIAMPLDVYAEFREQGPKTVMPTWMGVNSEQGKIPISCIFAEVEAEDGTIGFAGPIDEIQAFLIDRMIKPLVVGEDPRASERIWDKMYRGIESHGRKGAPMQALSAVDCAIWDLKGKLAGEPVYRLVGGPLRDRIPAYASALGFGLNETSINIRISQILKSGYKATKWFFRYGPGSGPEGIEKNVEMVRMLREAAGDDIDIMFDCWRSWDVRYTLEMGEKIAQYNPRWLEEPIFADQIESHAFLRNALPFPISTGEHEYTRWGFKALMDAGAADVLQPDVLWAGGVTELVKICALGSTYEVQIIPHAHTVATVQVLAAQSASLCPMLEFLINHSVIHQFFFRQPIEPANGVVVLPEGPGMGVEIDESKVQSRKILDWDGA